MKICVANVDRAIQWSDGCVVPLSLTLCVCVRVQAERKAKEAKKRHEVALKTCKDLRSQLAESHAATAQEVCVGCFYLNKNNV